MKRITGIVLAVLSFLFLAAVVFYLPAQWEPIPLHLATTNNFKQSASDATGRSVSCTARVGRRQQLLFSIIHFRFAEDQSSGIALEVIG